uniref:Uncharacterized protein n=1 Tax=Tanacetum cinerariifolium TaxID=118510 RepID=A0A699HEH3_TANCI|nr:hypothetical protein [Tanacetum cinerariifolium]
MGDENPIRTIGDHSKPSHEGYRNTIELPKGNTMVPLRSTPSIVILHKEDEVNKEENVKPNATEYNDHKMTAKVEEKVKEESKDEFKKRSKKKKRKRRT